MEKYIKIYQVLAYYTDSDGKKDTFSFLCYGEEEKLLEELQNFYEMNKGEKNVINFHVDIFEGTYPVSSENELVYYEANQIDENLYVERYADLEVLIDKIKYEFNDYEYNDIRYVSLEFKEDGSIDIGTDYITEYLVFEDVPGEELYYVNSDGVVVKEEELKRVLK